MYVFEGRDMFVPWYWPPSPPKPSASTCLSLLPAVFTNRVEDMRLQDLADVDSRQVVQQVQEQFGDFLALEPHHFIIPLQRPHLAFQPSSWDFGASSDMIAKLTEGLAALVLALRRRFVIRYG
jgi:vacuolar protein sorting-associated protein 45